MARLPGQFRRGGEAAIASYSYTDVAEGTGVVSFYGAKSGTGTYLLTNSTVYSDEIATSGAMTSESFTKELDLDFDVEMNLPKNVKGKAMINVPVAMRMATSSKQYWTFIYPKLRKWDGTTETDIVSASGAVFSHTTTGVNETENKMHAVELTVPLTHFKKGESLRLTIEGYAKHAAAAVGDIYVGHDPKSRAATWFDSDPTILTANIPFRLDL